MFAIKYVTIWILTCLASEEAVEHYLWESERKKIWYPEQVDEGQTNSPIQYALCQSE